MQSTTPCALTALLLRYDYAVRSEAIGCNVRSYPARLRLFGGAPFTSHCRAI
ncbi:MAG TPA: hypothetical protein VLG76_08875 [Rhabdochlamydiaceae bacterium]|nr:hypothetical protein [Rhabdochlamydiaceae bacterium]